MHVAEFSYSGSLLEVSAESFELGLSFCLDLFGFSSVVSSGVGIGKFGGRRLLSVVVF